MRNVMTFAVAVCLFPLAVLGGTLPPAEVSDGVTTVYANLTSAPITVTIQGTDGTGGGNSEVQLMRAGSNNVINARFVVPDGKTMAYSFPIGARESLKFACKVASGSKCSYSLSVP